MRETSYVTATEWPSRTAPDAGVQRSRGQCRHPVGHVPSVRDTPAAPPPRDRRTEGHRVRACLLPLHRHGRDGQPGAQPAAGVEQSGQRMRQVGLRHPATAPPPRPRPRHPPSRRGIVDPLIDGRRDDTAGSPAAPRRPGGIPPSFGASRSPSRPSNSLRWSVGWSDWRSPGRPSWRSPRTATPAAPSHRRPHTGIPNVSGKKRKLLLRGVLTLHRQHLNHPCLRTDHSSRYRTTSALGKLCCTADPRAAARQIRASKHLRHPVFVPVRFAPAHLGSSRNWRGARRRVAVSRLSRDGAPPCPCRSTAATRRTSPVGRAGVVRAG
jgi:hypothetical protein